MSDAISTISSPRSLVGLVVSHTGAVHASARALPHVLPRAHFHKLVSPASSETDTRAFCLQSRSNAVDYRYHIDASRPSEAVLHPVLVPQHTPWSLLVSIHGGSVCVADHRLALDERNSQPSVCTSSAGYSSESPRVLRECEYKYLVMSSFFSPLPHHRSSTSTLWLEYSYHLPCTLRGRGIL